MHATFLQKVILCTIAGFLAACLWQWGVVFVTGADDALNGGYNGTPRLRPRLLPKSRRVAKRAKAIAAVRRRA